MQTLGGMNPEERKTTGQALNALKEEIAALINRQESALRRQDMDQRLANETIDITLSPRPERKGHIHPISQTIEELTAIFADMGFTVAEGPDIEDDFHNFTALNFPPGHPAREMQDTFFLPEDKTEQGERAKKLLRTHTSPVQIRHMSANKPPIKIICFGRTYRSDYDMTHTPMFHQMECLYIDKNVTMGHLKGCLSDFVRAFFGVPDLPVRFRPSFFPFTEPSAEVDIGCSRKDGQLKLGRAEEQDWLEILGSGMVHPNVLKNCGIDPNEYQGFAFGCGIERIAMLKYGIPDLRTFFESDVRWLSHYGFDPLNRPNNATG
jgi:phenylalanyl-tRNA synthetase alpha chain